MILSFLEHLIPVPKTIPSMHIVRSRRWCRPTISVDRSAMACITRQQTRPIPRSSVRNLCVFVVITILFLLSTMHNLSLRVLFLLSSARKILAMRLATSCLPTPWKLVPMYYQSTLLQLHLQGFQLLDILLHYRYWHLARHQLLLQVVDHLCLRSFVVQVQSVAQSAAQSQTRLLSRHGADVDRDLL